MIIEESFEVNAPLSNVWEFFSDFQSVSGCIPGIEEFTQIDENKYTAKLKQRISYLTVTFQVESVVTNLTLPSYLSWETRGKALGLPSNLTMRDEVVLESVGSDGDKTLIRYVSNTAISGKLATLGNSIIKAKAKEVTKEFAANVNRQLTGEIETELEQTTSPRWLKRVKELF